MLQTVTAKLKILVDPASRKLLRDTMKAYSNACNEIAEYIFRTHDLKRYSVHKEVYYPIRERYGLRSQMAESCIRTVVGAYRTILANQKEWIKPGFLHPQLDLVWNRDYSLSGKTGLFSVNTLEGRIKVPFCKQGYEQYFSEGCRFGTAKLVTKHGKFFLHVPVTYEIRELKKEEVTNVVGIDRGIRFWQSRMTARERRYSMTEDLSNRNARITKRSGRNCSRSEHRRQDAEYVRSVRERTAGCGM